MEEPQESRIHISWSQLKIHAECHQKSYLSRSHQRSIVADKRNMLPGTVVDRAMRKWLNAEEQIPGAMASFIEETLAEEEREIIENEGGTVKWRDSEDKSKVVEMCKEASNNLEVCLNALVVPYRYEVAKRFVVPVEFPFTEDEYRTADLVGEMDLLVQDDEDQFHVYDLKVTRNAQYWKGTTGQLIFYDLITQMMFNIDRCADTGLIFPLLKDKILLFDFTELDYSQMWARIHRYALDVWKEHVKPKKDDKGCDYCDVRASCSKFAPQTGALKLGGSMEDLFRRIR